MVSSRITIFGLEMKHMWSAQSIRLNLIELLFHFVATVEVSPPLKKTDNLKQLLTSNVSLNSSGSLG